MFAFLLSASLSLAPAAPAYAADSLYAFVAASNDRIVDGYSYSNRHGIVSAGLLYSTPAGFFASSELSSFEGNGVFLPAEHLVSMDSAAGWRKHAKANTFSVALLDYRTVLADVHVPTHQGIALRYQRDAFALEFAFEHDKPYVHHRYGSLAADMQRMFFSWSEPIGEDVRWSAGIGSARLSGIPGRRDFISAGTQWRWKQFEWQFTLVHARDETARPWIEDNASTRLQLRVSKAFRLR